MSFSKLHERALILVSSIQHSEVELIDVFQDISKCMGFRELGYSSLHVYAVDALSLSDESAYKFVRVSRKCVQVPALKDALRARKFSMSNAVVICSVINFENQDHWLSLASSSSKRELERLVAEAQPEKPKPEKFRPQGNKTVRIELSVPQETFELLKRSQDLVAQKKGSMPSMADVLQVLAHAFVKREDPVAKADRNSDKTVPGDKTGVHKVHRRDRGRCQFKHANGTLCNQRKWLHVHHKKPKAEGGTDDPENLITLCSAHHRLVHEKGVPLH